jgi:hypothetical protein
MVHTEREGYIYLPPLEIDTKCECVFRRTRPACGARLFYGTVALCSGPLCSGPYSGLMILNCGSLLWFLILYAETPVSGYIAMNHCSMRWSSHQCTGTWYLCVFCMFYVLCVLCVLYVLCLRSVRSSFPSSDFDMEGLLLSKVRLHHTSATILLSSKVHVLFTVRRWC